MKEIVTKKYKANDGSIWETKKECLEMDKKLDWQNNIPSDILMIKDCIVKIFNIEDTEDWFMIERQDTFGCELQFDILFNPECSNKQYTKAIGELLITLSSLPHSFVSVDGYGKSYCCIEIDNYRYKEDLKYLQEIVTLKNSL